MLFVSYSYDDQEWHRKSTQILAPMVRNLGEQDGGVLIAEPGPAGRVEVVRGQPDQLAQVSR